MIVHTPRLICPKTDASFCIHVSSQSYSDSSYPANLRRCIAATYSRPRSFQNCLPLADCRAYSFTNQNNQTLNNESFLGKVQLINFFFTSCHGPCPRLMADISKVEREVDNAALQILSISVDPSRDTPEVLQQYKEKFPAKVATWHLATTDKASLLRFAEDGLKLALGEEIDLHSTRVVLVDQKGNMRGLFDPKEDADALVLAIRSLL
jgi:protein SCO1/2